MDQLTAKNMVDGFTMLGCVLVCGFVVVAATNAVAIAYLVKIHKALKKTP